ncbi:MAG: T9SS type A sorting domain-containing protein [Bacteroidetes bacterium]|nr:T9SS type A sorting domain-containing protein [Bacteroidota bacterium]
MMRTWLTSGILATALLLCGFGTNLEAGTWSWTGGSSGAWETGSNWLLSGTSSNTYPASGDIAVFSSSASVTLSGNLTISQLVIQSGSSAVTVTLTTDYTLTTTNLNVLGAASYPAKLILQRSTTTNFVLSTQSLSLDNGTISSTSGAKLELTRGGSGSITMNDVDDSYVAAGVSTTIVKASPFGSNVRFDGDLAFTTTSNILLGDYHLYLGKQCDLTVNGSFGGNDNGFIATAGDASTPKGTVRRQFDAVNDTFYFPIGPVGERMSPIGIRIIDPSTSANFTSASPWPYISVRCLLNGSQGHPMNTQSSKIWVYWVVKGEGISEPVYLAGRMYLHNNYRSGNPTVYSALYAPHYEDAGQFGGWDLTGTQNGTTTGNNREVPFHGSPGFGDYNIGRGDPFGGDPIPVELTSFSARFIDDAVRLNWNTATELNNYGFAIERSMDREHWEEVGFVEGYGTSNSPKSYAWTDRLDERLTRLPELAYRLRQIDRDGTTEYSNVVLVNTGALPEGVSLHAAYPNPFNPVTTISFSIAEATQVTLRVYNTLGQIVATLLEGSTMDAGLHTMTFNAETLPSGLYMAVLEAEGAIQQKKLVLNK